MGLSRPNQQLRRELRNIAHQVDEATHRLWTIGKTLPDEKLVELMSAVVLLQDCVDRANAMAERVKAGEIQASS